MKRRTFLLGSAAGAAKVAANLAAVPALRAQSRPTFTADRSVWARILGWRVWGGKALLGVEDPFVKAPLLYLVDGDGNRQVFLFWILDSASTSVYGIARSEDGTIGLCGSVVTAERHPTSFIATISPDRKQQNVIRTWPYVAQRLAITPNGRIWTAGSVRDEENTQREVAYNVLHLYERSGRLLQTWQVKARGRTGMLDHAAESSWLFASPDRVGWLAGGGQYFEYSPEGREISRYNPPPGVFFGWPGADWPGDDKRNQEDHPHVLSAAMSQDNELFVCATRKTTWQLLMLDRPSRTWVAVTPEQKGWNSIAGFDGGDPIMLPKIGDLGEIQRLKRNQPSKEQ